MNKTLHLLLLFILIFFMSSCGGSPNETATTFEKALETKEVQPDTTDVKEDKTVGKKELQPEQKANTTELYPVTLVKVTDGDTIRVTGNIIHKMFNKKEVPLRYLLIDTPETNHPRLGKQPFGQEAKERNAELLQSGEISIEFDIGERLDKYDRVLAYLYVDGVSVQETLLEEGLARVAYVYPPNTRHLKAFEAAQERAKEKEIAIWSIENYTTSSGFSNESGESKTHDSPSKSSEDKESYQNCTKLQEFYPNGVSSDHPAYEEKHDRDQDGHACER